MKPEERVWLREIIRYTAALLGLVVLYIDVFLGILFRLRHGYDLEWSESVISWMLAGFLLYYGRHQLMANLLRFLFLFGVWSFVGVANLIFPFQETVRNTVLLSVILPLLAWSLWQDYGPKRKKR